MKSLFRNESGQLGLNQLPSVIVVFAVVAITLGLAATILTQVQSTQTSNSVAYNASAGGLSAFAQIASFEGLLGLVLIAGVILTVLIVSFRT